MSDSDQSVGGEARFRIAIRTSKSATQQAMKRVTEAGYIKIKKKDQLRIADPINNQLMVFLNYMAPVVQVLLFACSYPL